ncbi:MAG: RDD family protein [Candidatus Heimdallarchaeaceae archaeon]
MSAKYFCPNCGAAVTPEDKFCQNCGTKLENVQGVSAPAYQAPVSQSGPVTPAPPYQQPSQQYQPYQPYVESQRIQQVRVVDPSQYMQIKASLGNRCLAYLIDSIIWSLISSFTGGLGACAVPFKDSIPEEGKSFGKQAMHIRVVDFNTGKPMTVGQGFVRNCLGNLVTLGFDIFVPICTSDGRRVGDYLAGTIVIEDM